MRGRICVRALLASGLLVSTMGFSLVATGSTGSAAVRLKNVSVAVYQASTPSLPVYVAASLGYFAQNGLNVTLDYVASGAASAAADASGSVNFYNSNIPIIMNLDNAGSQTKEIVGLYTNFPQALYCSTAVAATLPAPTGTNANAIFTALKGVSVGITSVGSLTWEMMEYGMVTAGLPLNYIKLVSAGSSVTALAAFQSGSIQCVIAYEPMQHVLASMKLGVSVMDWQAHQGPSLYANYTFSGIAAADSYIAQNPKTVEAFAKSIAEADAYTSNPKNAPRIARLILSYFPGLPLATLTDIIANEVSKDVSASLTKVDVANAELEAIAISEVSKTLPYRGIVFVPPIIKITCVKGKLTVKRSGVSPTCPVGYHKKA